MKMLRTWLPFLAMLTLMFVPLAANAQSPLVPECGITDPANPESAVSCNLCHLGLLFQNIINFLIYGLAIPLSAALFAYAGVLYVTGGSNPTRISKAHKIFKNVGIGFLIAISGWLVINTILTVAFDKSFFNGGDWFRIQCVSKITANPEGGGRLIGTSINDLLKEIIPSATGGGGVVGGGGEVVSGTCTGCVTLDQNIPGHDRTLTCKANTNGGCQVSTEMNLKLISLTQNMPTYIDWYVSEAWPPVATHQDSCHLNGTCVDISLGAAPYNQANVLRVQQAAQSSGLCAVYEPADGNCSGYTSCIGNRPAQSHFSVYPAGYSGCR